MTSRTSWFNKGIFTSNLRRFAWGGVLYTILLFLICTMPVLFIVNPETHWILTDGRHTSLLLTDTYLYLPIVAALIVPTVVALLSFRFVHSKKTSIFLHSLPISRKGIFVSTILSAFSLMAVPVLVNGVILMILSLCGYGMLFSLSSCVIWVALNILAQVLMFSVATFACFLTGNTFAAVVLNGLIHLVMIVIAASFSSLSQVFLYGFYNQNLFLNATTEWNFVAYLIEICNRAPYSTFDWGKLVLMLVFAAVLYLAAWLLYRARRLETSEDVAGYKILNPIFKYCLVFLSALGTFAISCFGLAESPTFCILIVVIVSAVVYFASEMILKKTLKVHGAYKGYLVFAAAFTVMSCIFAFTTFFGFETRVPEASDVESVGIYDYRHGVEETFVADPEVIARAIEAHGALVEEENIYRIKEFLPDRQYNLQIRYQLKNGTSLVRSYSVTENFFFDMMQDLYTSQEYKQKNIELFCADIGRIYGVELSNGVRLKENEVEDFLLCLRADLRDAEYADVHYHEQWSSNVYIEYIPTSDLGLVAEGHEIRSLHQRINASFKNTVAWLREHGHLTSIIANWNYDLALLTAEQWNEYNGVQKEVIEKAAGTMTAEVRVKEMPKVTDFDGVKRISDENKVGVYTFMVTTTVPFEPGREYAYRLCRVDGQGYLMSVAAFYETPEVAALYNSIQ